MGTVLDDAQAPLAFANVVVLAAADSTIVKVEVSEDDGAFAITNLAAGRYIVSVKYVGLPDADVEAFDLGSGESRDLGTINMREAAQELQVATVTAQRRIVEVKADRTIFNVEGTINSAGGDGMSLLRKAPGVVVDNSDNIIVMGRAGVLVYIDGKRSPLAGEALTAFLRGLPAEQIDRIDIITNPGAKYEAEGNAGIIDIRLKKNESWGSNGSVSSTVSQGEYFRGNVSATVNHREGGFNTFATGGVFTGTNFNESFFDRTQSGLAISDRIDDISEWQGGNLKLGTDYRFAERHTIGVQVNGNYNDNGGPNVTRATFARVATPNQVDSILVSTSDFERDQYNVAGNLNYRFDDAAGQTLNFDLDYGAFRRDASSTLDNQYFGPDGIIRAHEHRPRIQHTLRDRHLHRYPRLRATRARWEVRRRRQVHPRRVGQHLRVLRDDRRGGPHESCAIQSLRLRRGGGRCLRQLRARFRSRRPLGPGQGL